ncbi:MAG: hypothetical protein K6F53_10485 [Lachnospiraceae bacterium]|nr:hypothetical protein [Lachnospiraceae bacterium]
MTSENGNFLTTMPVAPTGYANGGFGGGWGNDIWLIIIILFAFGGFGGFGMGGGYGSGNVGGMIYPWMNQSQQVNDGFRDQMINSSINGIQSSITSGFGDVQNSLCSGFAGVNAGIANGFAQAEIAENSRQMANMNQMFGLSQQFAQCCCDNKLATATLSADLAREACADRAAVSSALRDVLEANNASTQRILDQMCSDKIDQKNERIQELQTQLTMAQLAASQNAQTATILANNEAQTTALEQYLAPVPRPAYIVPQPGCSQNYGCGCGNF